MADVQLDKSDERVDAGSSAGDSYVTELETIRNTLDKDDNTGTTLGSMVKAQLEMTEAETRYQVKAGIPKKVTTSVQQGAQEVKKAAG